MRSRSVLVAVVTLVVTASCNPASQSSVLLDQWLPEIHLLDTLQDDALPPPFAVLPLPAWENSLRRWVPTESGIVSVSGGAGLRLRRITTTGFASEHEVPTGVPADSVLFSDLLCAGAGTIGFTGHANRTDDFFVIRDTVLLQRTPIPSGGGLIGCGFYAGAWWLLDWREEGETGRARLSFRPLSHPSTRQLPDYIVNSSEIRSRRSGLAWNSPFRSFPRIGSGPGGGFLLVADSLEVLDLFLPWVDSARLRIPLGGQGRGITLADRAVALASLEATIDQRDRAGASDEGESKDSVGDLLSLAGQSITVGAERSRIGRLLWATDSLVLLERADLDPNPVERGDLAVFDVVHLRAGHVARFGIPPGQRLLSAAAGVLFVCVEAFRREDDHSCRRVALHKVPTGRFAHEEVAR